MAFSKYFLYGSSNDSDISNVPLYTDKEDLLLYCDKAFKIVEHSDLGILFAGAIDPSLSDTDRGKFDINEEKSSLVHNIKNGTKNTILYIAEIDGGEYGTILESVSFSVKGFSQYSSNPGEKNNTAVYVLIDWKDGDKIKPLANLSRTINQSWINHQFNISQKALQVEIPSGKHTLSLVVSTNNQSLDGNAYFEVSQYSFSCVPIKCKQVPSKIHILDSDGKEYMLCNPRC